VGDYAGQVSLGVEAYGLIEVMQPHEQFQPKGPGTPNLGQDKNPFKGHIARPQEVPLARPEYTPIEQLQRAQQAAVAAPTPQPVTPTPLPPDHPYSFILNPQQPTNRSPLNVSLPLRIGMIAGLLVVLLVGFSLVKGAIGGGNKLGETVATVQRQQEMLHVLTGALQQQSLSDQNKSFALTAQLALGSSESKLITYLSKNGTKLKTPTLNLKISKTVDAQLASAIASSTYDSTFNQVMQSQLTAYINGLNAAYNQNKGQKGRTLLQDDYRQAKLLQQQLTTPTN